MLGPLLLGVPAVAGVAPLQETEPSGPTLYVSLAVIGVLLVVIVARQALRRPVKPAPLAVGESRDYGLAGGAVCRSCGLPFARDMLAMNLLMGKLTRCPHCGNWAVLPAASPAALEAAEERERQALRSGGTPPATPPATPPPAAPSELSKDEQLRRRIEESRYE